MTPINFSLEGMKYCIDTKCNLYLLLVNPLLRAWVIYFKELSKGVGNHVAMAGFMR